MPSGERPAVAPPGRTTGAYAAQPGPGAHRQMGGPPPTPFGGTPRAGGTPTGGHSSGNFPAAPPGQGSLADNKVVWIVLGVVALLAVVVILVAMSGGGDESGGGSGGASAETAAGSATTVPSGYTDDVEAAFVGNCSETGGNDPVCQCAWEAIVEQIPFEDFAAMEARLIEDPSLTTDTERLAAEFPELTAIMTGCETTTSDATAT